MKEDVTQAGGAAQRGLVRCDVLRVMTLFGKWNRAKETHGAEGYEKCYVQKSRNLK